MGEQVIPDADNTPAPSRKVTDVVYLIHGIRDEGEWYQVVEQVLSSDSVEVIGCRHGWVSPQKFLSSWNTDTEPMHQAHQELMSIAKQFKGARISVIAHSYGTHLFLKMIEEFTHLEIWRVVLCGSVPKQDFRWDKVVHRIGQKGEPSKRYILNDCGDLDVWPLIGKAFGPRYGVAGVHGFSGPHVTNRFHVGKHGLFMAPQFIEHYWRPFIYDGHIVPGVGKQAAQIKGWLRTITRWDLRRLAKLCLFALIVLLVLLIPGGWFAWTYFKSPEFEQASAKEYMADFSATLRPGVSGGDENFQSKYLDHEIEWTLEFEQVYQDENRNVSFLIPQEDLPQNGNIPRGRNRVMVKFEEEADFNEMKLLADRLAATPDPEHRVRIRGEITTLPGGGTVVKSARLVRVD